MKIRVKTFASVAELVGKREIEIEVKKNATVYELFQALFRKFGAKVKGGVWDTKRDAPRAYIKIMLNGRDIDFIRGIKTELNDGDVVAIFPPSCWGVPIRSGSTTTWGMFLPRIHDFWSFIQDWAS